MWTNVKAVAEKHFCHRKMWSVASWLPRWLAKYLGNYILLVDIIIMMKWLCTYWPTINKQTDLNKPSIKQKLFKK